MSEAVSAVLLTDVVESTRVTAELGAVRAAEVWAAHDRAARDLLAAHGGREIDKTDGFLLLFDSAPAAAQYALAYHEALRRLSDQEGVAFAARAALHVDRVRLRENAPDDVARGAKPLELEGPAKAVAERVLALAHAGKTLLTGAARGSLRARLPDGVAVESHGHWRLKGVVEPVAIFELGRSDERPFAPPDTSPKGHRVVRVEERWGPAHEVPHSLPAERDAFVGRAEELAALARRLDEGARVLTILGTGGTGKTRLATRYAWSWQGDYPGGTWFCDLSEARSVDGIVRALATTLGVALGSQPVNQLGHAVAGRGRCLLVLDNFEQVAEHAEETLGAWLQRAPEASFLVTSRALLNLPGEEAFTLEPLPVDGAALELFEVRARSRVPSFGITAENHEAVRDIVRLLDGLPLAIELAAARIAILSPKQLLDRLGDRFSALARGTGVGRRQSTLRAAIDWSWELLETGERAALAQATVFEGGFRLEAAEEVIDLAAWPEAGSVLDVVQALVDKSLLRAWEPVSSFVPEGSRAPRFGMYASIQAHAAEKLRTPGVIPDGGSGPEAEEAVARRHGAHYARLGAEEAIHQLQSHHGAERRETVTREIDNLVAACRRAVARADASVAAAAFQGAFSVLHFSGPQALIRSLVTDVLSLDDLTPLARAQALVGLCESQEPGADPAERRRLVEEAVAIAREHGLRRFEGIAVGNLANVHLMLGRYDEVRELYDEAMAIHREVGNRGYEGMTHGNLGAFCQMHGRLDEAREHYEAALEVNRETGDSRVQAAVLGNLGVLHAEQGRPDEARACYEAALEVERRDGLHRYEGFVLSNLGILSRTEGNLDEARQQHEAALAIHREVGNRAMEGTELGYLGIIRAEEGRPEEARSLQEAALAIHREVGNRRFEGILLGSLGELQAAAGRWTEAWQAFDEGEAILRELEDADKLGTLLARRGLAHALAGDAPKALRCRDEAEQLAGQVGAGDRYEFGRVLGRLREKLSTTGGGDGGAP